ncbi:MAG: M48 family metallopeptidase [Motiliproteus sp.]
MLYRWGLGLWILLLIGCSGAPSHPSVYSRGVVVWHQQQALLPEDLNQQIISSYQRLQQLSDSSVALVIAADPNPNAFAAIDDQGAASVRLNAGLIDMIGYDLDAIVFVLGHELGHIELGQLAGNNRQGVKRQDSIVDVLSTVADIIVPFSSLLVLAGNEMLKAGYSRDDEREADRYGLELMVRAGFDPQGAVRFQQRLQLLPKGSGLGFLATHPDGDERVENIQKLIESVPTAGVVE